MSNKQTQNHSFLIFIYLLFVCFLLFNRFTWCANHLTDPTHVQFICDLPHYPSVYLSSCTAKRGQGNTCPGCHMPLLRGTDLTFTASCKCSVQKGCFKGKPHLIILEQKLGIVIYEMELLR